MAVNYTSLLGLAKPVTGTEAGTWGDVVNDYLTTYLDAAVAGAQTISGTQTAVTLTVANGTALVQAAATTAGSAQYQIINCTGSPASTLVITAPSASKVYLVINATSTNQSVTVRGAGSPPTTGITIPALTRSLVAWNGSDYILIASNRITDLTGTLATTNGGTGLTAFTSGGAVYATSTSALTTGTLPVASGGTGATTLTGVVKASGTSAFTASNVSLSSEVTGTLPVGNGGTGLSSSGSAGSVLVSNGTSLVSSLSNLGRNKIINGGMVFAQRGASFTSATAGYTLDRWTFSRVTTGAFDITHSTDVPSNAGFTNSLRFTVTTADSSVAANESTTVSQRIEAPYILDLIGKTCTISFWVRSAKTGAHSVTLAGVNTVGATSAYYVTSYTVNTANTWEYKTITIANGLDTSYVWAGVNFVLLTFTLFCGTDNQASTTNAWVVQSGTTSIKFSVASQVNVLDTVGNIFAITGVQLELGATATAFDLRDRAIELTLCQRYYSKSYNYNANPPGWIETAGQLRTIGVANSAPFNVIFPTTMRGAPTVTAYSPATGASGVVRDLAANADIAVTGSDFSTTGGNFYQTAGVSNNAYITAHWVASAEL